MTDYGVTIQHVETSQTGWYQAISSGEKLYVINGVVVSREDWLAYVAEHPELFSDPKWSEA